MARILSVSYDGDLLCTRELLLRAQGYDVVSALGPAQAMTHCQSGTKFDLFILGHSIPKADKESLVGAFRVHCPAAIVALKKPGEAPVEGADFEIDPEPEKLLALVAALISGSAASA
jgi:DNA-binding NtrC family response regulator